MFKTIRMTRVQRTFLIASLIVLGWVIAGFMTPVASLGCGSTTTNQMLAVRLGSGSGQSSMIEASSELVMHLEQDTAQFAREFQHLISQHASQAAQQFAKTVPTQMRPTDDLGETIELTLLEKLGETLQAAADRR